ncbi:hypothetical protein ACLOJK_001516 [Asimina triloba]
MKYTVATVLPVKPVEGPHATRHTPQALPDRLAEQRREGKHMHSVDLECDLQRLPSYTHLSDSRLLLLLTRAEAEARSEKLQGGK